MLSLGYPKINFQVANEMAYEELLRHVRETVDTLRDSDKEISLTPGTADSKASAFQVSVTLFHLYILVHKKLHIK